MRVGFRNIKSKHSAAGCAWQVSGMSRAGSGPPPSGPALARTSLNSDVARLVTVANDTPAPVQLLWVNYEGARPPTKP